MGVHTPETVKAQMQADIDAANVKTGRTDATVHDAINTLIAGYGQGGDPGGGNDNDVINIYTTHSQFDEPWERMPETIKLHLMVQSTIGCAMNTSQTDKRLNIVITGKQPTFGVSTGSFNSSNGVIQSIDADGVTVPTYYNQTFRGQKLLERINAMLDFAGKTPDRVFRENYKLVDVRFAPNSILNTASGGFIQWSPLSDDSVISLANALISGAHTISLHATPKARCDEILGTVTQKTADDGTVYDFFTADSAGTVTLTEFITITKGWTIA